MRSASTVVSLTWTGILAPPPPPVVWRERPSDWGVGGLANRWLHFSTGFRLVMEHRDVQRLIVCNAGMDLLAAALAKRLPTLRRQHLVAVDFLRPPHMPEALLRFLLRSVDEFVVIRRSDVEGLVALGVGRDRCRFVPWPASSDLDPQHASEGGYVYSAGNAQRDWATLIAAIEASELPAIIGAPIAVPTNATAVGPLSPREGRKTLLHATVVALSTFDTHLPAGPLMLLDAMAAGKAIVATDAAAHRDYVEHEHSALLVPPGDVDALADALIRAWTDSDLRRRLGAAAREAALELTPEQFWTGVLVS